MVLRLFIIFILTFSFFSCSKKEVIYSSSESIDPYKSYNQGVEAFEKNQFFFAHKKFSEAELNFKQVELAAKSAIMSSFALYGINFYREAEENLIRYLKTYPADKYIIYAHYLIFWSLARELSLLDFCP